MLILSLVFFFVLFSLGVITIDYLPPFQTKPFCSDFTIWMSSFYNLYKSPLRS